MHRIARSAIYLLVLVASTATFAFAFNRLFDWIATDGIGLHLLAATLLVILIVMAWKIESAQLGDRQHRMQSGKPSARFRSRSLLLQGVAPPPVTLGIAVGALIAFKMS
jgi:hypothetical protein